MPLELHSEFLGLVWLPDQEAGNWHLWCPLLVVLVGAMSYKQEAKAIGDGSCGARPALRTSTRSSR